MIIVENEYINKLLINIFIGLLTILLYIIISNKLMPKTKNVVVFDLDETLGSFAKLAILEQVIEKRQNKKITKDDFKCLIEMNPEFIRPGIISILKYIVEKRKQGKCDKIMIYTNNQGPKEWVENISDYFSYKVGETVFDQIICAFKINGKRVEPGRTSHDKSYSDFINCTKMPNNTQVFFVDDVHHAQMEHDNVYYINIKPYHYKPSIDYLLDKYCRNDVREKKELLNISKKLFHPAILEGEEKLEDEQKLDEIIGKCMYQHMCDFFSSTSNKSNKTNKTRKKKQK